MRSIQGCSRAEKGGLLTLLLLYETVASPHVVSIQVLNRMLTYLLALGQFAQNTPVEI